MELLFAGAALMAVLLGFEDKKSKKEVVSDNKVEAGQPLVKKRSDCESIDWSNQSIKQSR
ncbi:hypothetical protein GCM10020331_065280 [Ectobacillus funiculus]